MASTPAGSQTSGFPFIATLSEQTEAAPLTTRDALLRAAGQAFGESGFDGVSIRDVERRAGVNRGVVGHYFGNKDRLWEAAVDAMMNELGTELVAFAGFAEVVTPAERSRIILKVTARFVRRRPEFFRIIIAEGDKDTPRLKRLTNSYLGELERFFREATGVDDDLPAETHAMRHFLLLGASMMIFTVPEYARQLFGVDVRDPDFADRFGDVVAEMWMRSRDLLEG